MLKKAPVTTGETPEESPSDLPSTEQGPKGVGALVQPAEKLPVLVERQWRLCVQGVRAKQPIPVQDDLARPQRSVCGEEIDARVGHHLDEFLSHDPVSNGGGVDAIERDQPSLDATEL